MRRRSVTFASLLFLLLVVGSCTDGEDRSSDTLSPSAGTLPATTSPPTASVPTPQLRIANEGQEDIHGLSVIFPESEVVEFGDVPAGTVTEYRHVPGGVYEYAAYEYLSGAGREIQPVIDWVGEDPMAGKRFTYRVQFEPREPTQLNLLGVVVDEG
jgi:hypothetical protein